MNKNRSIVPVIAFLCCIFSANTSWALTKGFEVLSFRPAADGGHYFTVYDSTNLGRWQWVAGTAVTYAYRPFQLTDNGVRMQGIVDHTIEQHIYGSIGLIDRWLEVGFELPIGWWVDWIDPTLNAPPSQNKQAIGDLQIHFKTELLNPDDHWIGLAVLPFVSIPTGYGRYYFGNGSFAGGGKVIAEVKPVKRLEIAVNAGVYARERFDFRNIEESNQLTYGISSAVNVVKDLYAAAELSGRTRLSGPFEEQRETPTEVLAGIKYAISDTGITVNAGGGAGLISGAGAPRYRAFAGLSYESPKRPPRPKPAPMPSTDIITETKIHFATDSYKITEEPGVLLGNLADVLRERPGVKIKILGYTDSRGGRTLNRTLSAQRAKKVKRYLEYHGVESTRMEVVVLGETSPKGDNKTAAGRAANRRVEFEIVE